MDTPYAIKVAIVLALLAIVASLATGLVRLLRDRGRTTATVKALTIRIGLSLALFALLILGVVTGVIVPHGVLP